MATIKTTSSYARPRVCTLELGIDALIVYIPEPAEGILERRVLYSAWQKDKSLSGYLYRVGKASMHNDWHANWSSNDAVASRRVRCFGQRLDMEFVQGLCLWMEILKL
jgi:hypothetical protein